LFYNYPAIIYRDAASKQTSLPIAGKSMVYLKFLIISAYKEYDPHTRSIKAIGLRLIFSIMFGRMQFTALHNTTPLFSDSQNPAEQGLIVKNFFFSIQLEEGNLESGGKDIFSGQLF
jgi:hypothetical protein